MTKFPKLKYYLYIIGSFLIVITIIAFTNTNVNHVSEQFVSLLDSYEGADLFEYQQTSTGEACLDSYDVGDGVVTFGFGNTFTDEASGIAYINELTNKNYEENDCILVDDLKTLQAVAIAEREDDINYLSTIHGVSLNQQQFDAIMLLYYLNESSIKDDDFWDLLKSDDLTIDSYISYFTDYYSQFNNYDKYKEGWNLRIIDSAQLFFTGDYERDF